MEELFVEGKYIVDEWVTPQKSNSFRQTTHFLNYKNYLRYVKKTIDNVLDELENNDVFYEYECKSLISYFLETDDFLVKDLKSNQIIYALETRKK